MTLEEALATKEASSSEYKTALHQKVHLDRHVQELRKIASNAHNDWASLEMDRRTAMAPAAGEK